MNMKTFLGTTICPLVQHVVATFQAIENKLSHAIHYQKNTVANQNTKQLLKSQYRVLLDNGFLKNKKGRTRKYKTWKNHFINMFAAGL